MIYTLTDEQIKELIQEYGGTISKIKEIERLLNLSGRVRDEEEYLYLVADCLARYVSNRLDVEYETTPAGKQMKYASLNSMVTYSIQRYEEEMCIDNLDENNYTF